MATSIDSQLALVRRIAALRPNDLVRAQLAHRPSEAELMHQQIKSVLSTFERVASDERIRRYIEKLQQGT